MAHPQRPNPEMTKEEENNAILGLSFPRKLWRIVEDAAFTSVHWNDEGDTVVIEADLVQIEVLQRRGTRQEYWGGLPFPFPGDLPGPGIELAFLTLALEGLML